MAIKKSDMGGRPGAALPATMKGGAMRVKMLVQVSGLRDGQDWPGPGEELDLPEDEARQLIQQAMAAPVDGEGPESATEDRSDVETTAADTRPRKGTRK